MNSLLTVIVPIYNIAPYLDKCVQSIVNQTYKNFEIILVDDGSPDNCPSICDEWVRKDDRVKVIHKENGGVSSARNEGLKLASGKWIWFVDGDDTVEPDALSKLLKYTEQNPDLLVFNRDFNEEYCKDEYFFDDYYFKYRFGFEPWNKLYKTEIIKQNNLAFDTEESIGEDLLFNAMYYQFAEKYLFVSDKLYNYRVRDDSAMAKKDPERLKKQLRVYSKLYEIYKDKADERILAQLFLMHLISGINQSDKADLHKKETEELICSSLKKHSFNKSAFKSATNSFLKSENSSVLGRIRIKLFCKFLSVNTRFALNVLFGG